MKKIYNIGLKRSLLLLVMVLILSLFLTQLTVLADGSDNPLFLLYHGGEQGVFDETVESGATGSIKFVLENGGQEDRTNVIFIYDAETSTNGGNQIMSPENYTKLAEASWFDYELEALTLAPGESIEKEISFTVPEGTPPGNYCAILAMYNAEIDDAVEATDEEKNIVIKINQAITQTTAIVIRVPGKYQRSMKLDDNFGHEWGTVKGNLLLSIPFTNESTAYDFPSFDLTIFDSSNTLLYTASRKLPIVYAQSSSNYLVDVSEANLPAGKYTVNVVMTYGNGEYNGRDEKTYILDLMAADVEQALIAEEKHDLRNASDLDLKGFFIFDKDKIITYALVGGGSLLLLIIIIMLLLKRPKGKRGKSRRSKKENIENEDIGKHSKK